MSLLFTALATVLALPLAFFLLSKVGIYLFAYVLRSLGWSIKSKTQGRRELILNRVHIENEEYRNKRRRPSSGTSGEDEEWEKVDNTFTGTASNGQPLGDEWEGIIGFFHPFW
jgi:alpha-1,2-mannosyltransferase